MRWRVIRRNFSRALAMLGDVATGQSERFKLQADSISPRPAEAHNDGPYAGVHLQRSDRQLDDLRRDEPLVLLRGASGDEFAPPSRWEYGAIAATHEQHRQLVQCKSIRSSKPFLDERIHFGIGLARQDQLSDLGVQPVENLIGGTRHLCEDRLGCGRTVDCQWIDPSSQITHRRRSFVEFMQVFAVVADCQTQLARSKADHLRILKSRDRFAYGSQDPPLYVRQTLTRCTADQLDRFPDKVAVFGTRRHDAWLGGAAVHGVTVQSSIDRVPAHLNGIQAVRGEGLKNSVPPVHQLTAGINARTAHRSHTTLRKEALHRTGRAS